MASYKQYVLTIKGPDDYDWDEGYAPCSFDLKKLIEDEYLTLEVSAELYSTCGKTENKE